MAFKLPHINKRLLSSIHLCILAILFFTINNAFAEISYNYDTAGRLTHATDDIGNAVVYTYDSNGNVISIFRTTTANLLPPVITDVNPGILRRGETADATITGTNLSGAVLAIDNAGLFIKTESVTDTEITLTMETSLNARIGPAILTITTPQGSDIATVQVKGQVPKVLNIIPFKGTSVGGTKVAVYGDNFTPDTTITINGVVAANTLFVGKNTISATTPPGIPNTAASVVAGNGNGTSSLINGFHYVFPFRMPVAISVKPGDTGAIAMTLTEPAATNLTATILIDNPAIVSTPASVTIPALSNSINIPVSGITEGITSVNVTLSGAVKSTTVISSASQIDSDGDGLTDAVEAELGANPVNSDSDNDGLPDGEEVNAHGTDPLNPDTDGDGINDSTEIAFGTSPTDNSSFPGNIGPGIANTVLSVFLPARSIDAVSGSSVSYSQSSVSAFLPMTDGQAGNVPSFTNSANISAFLPMTDGQAGNVSSFTNSGNISAFLPMTDNQAGNVQSFINSGNISAFLPMTDNQAGNVQSFSYDQLSVLMP